MTEDHLKIADRNTKLGAWVEERSTQKHKRLHKWHHSNHPKTADDECAPIFWVCTVNQSSSNHI